MRKSAGAMVATLLLVAVVAQGAPLADSASGGIIDLSCMEALVAIDSPELAGVFSFIAEKDSSNAFANLVVQKGKALKKYVAKVERDSKVAGGIPVWDHETILVVLSILSGPMAETFEKPSTRLTSKMTELSLVPTLSLEAVTAGRKKQ